MWDARPHLLQTGRSALAPDEGLKAVRDLYEKQDYITALSKFNGLSSSVKTGYDGQLLLCKIQTKKRDFESAIQACDVAIRLRQILQRRFRPRHLR